MLRTQLVMCRRTKEITPPERTTSDSTPSQHPTKLARTAVHDDGVYLRADGQRYLDFSAFKKLLGDEPATVQLIDKYIATGIVYRGLILKCLFCRSVDWFDLADVNQSFRCKRCSRAQLIGSQHQVRADGEAAWFYKLDQLILRGLQNNMQVPVLALDWLRRQSQDSFLSAADMDFFEGGL